MEKFCDIVCKDLRNSYILSAHVCIFGGKVDKIITFLPHQLSTAFICPENFQLNVKTNFHDIVKMCAEEFIIFMQMLMLQ